MQCAICIRVGKIQFKRNMKYTTNFNFASPLDDYLIVTKFVPQLECDEQS